jgi:hypothetical protein
MPNTTIKVRVSETVLALPVCWSASKVADAEAQYADGIVDVDKYVPQGQGPGSVLERIFLKKLALKALAERG